MALIQLLIERLLYWFDCLIGRKPLFFYQDWRKTIRVDQYGPNRTLSFGGKLYQSVTTDDGLLKPNIWNYFLISPYLLDNPAKPFCVCVLGFGGGVVAKRLLDYFPQAIITGVEIDPTVIDVAKRFFVVPSRVKVICGDAASYIHATRRQFNIIMVDIFDGNKTIDLVYQEQFLDDCLARLATNGLMAINFYDSEHKKSVLMQKLATRKLAVFTTQIKTSTIHNTVLFVTNKHNALQNVAKNARLRQQPDLDRFVASLKETINRVQ